MKELAFLVAGIVVGGAADYLYRAKALAEYMALKKWANGELAAVPAWFESEIKKGGARVSAQLQEWAKKL